MSIDLTTQPKIFAANVAASGWWVADQLCRHGPGWQMVPPILIGLSSLIGAVRGFLNDRQARQHKAELHQLELMKLNHVPSRT